MYNTDSILKAEKQEPIKREDILNKISEYDIFRKYIGDFRIGKVYNSPLREDNAPSFGIFVSNKDGTLLYKDLANGDCGDVFKFVKKLKGLTTYNQTLLTIVEDLSVHTIGKMTNNEKLKAPTKETIISVIRKPFNREDINFWREFGISRDVLDLYQVYPISKCFVNKIMVGRYESDSPLFCYKVFNKFKIYKPLGKKADKWRGNLTSMDIQGFEQLPEKGSLLIITKSLKDVMVLREMGYDAIAPSSESTMIPEIVINNLKNRFKRILIFYDRDKAGIIFARKLSKEYNFNCILINKKYKTKDISDLVKKMGYAQALTIFEQMTK